MRLPIQILIIILLSGCARSTEKKNQNSINDPHPFITINNGSFKINAVDIKTHYRGYSTSTILNDENTYQLYKPDTVGFFGEYILIDSTSLERIGSLIVFNSCSPQNWRYDNDDDIFIMLDYTKGDMSFFNGIRIGLNECEVQEKLKNRFHYKKGTSVHAEIDNYSIDLYITDSKVSRIEINFEGKR
jgi:hypothetical protein